MKNRSKREVIRLLVNILEEILETMGTDIPAYHRNLGKKAIRIAIKYQQSPEGQRDDV